MGDRDRCLREVLSVAGMPENPNLLRYYRGWTEGGHFCVQMEFCAGGSLKRLLQHKPHYVSLTPSSPGALSPLRAILLPTLRGTLTVEHS